MGADHKRSRRGYVTPAAVQRTELLEWAVTQRHAGAVLAEFKPYQVYESGLALPVFNSKAPWLGLNKTCQHLEF